jgi:transcriptional regulator with XRE-family HTH domain
MVDLKRFRKEKNLKQIDIAEKLGIAQSYVSAIEKGERPLTDALYEKLELFYPDLREYQSNTKESTYEHSNAEPIGLNIKIIKLVNQYAYAGYMNGYQNPTYYDELPDYPLFVNHEARGNYLAFEVRGDSMADGTDESIKDGDIVIGREIPKQYWSSKLHIKKWSTYVIAHAHDGIVVKNITEHDVATGDIVAHSLNPEWEDRLYNLGEIVKLYNVIKVVRDKR